MIEMHGTANVCCLVFCSAMKIRFSESVRVYKTENENYFFTVRINTPLNNTLSVFTRVSCPLITGGN